MTTSPTAGETAAGLEALAAHIRANPILADYMYAVGDYGLVDIALITISAVEFGACVAAFGGGDKIDGGPNQLAFRRDFGGGVHLRVVAPKSETCKRVQTGTETVTREVYPEDVQPTVVTEEVPVYEWVCPDSFLALAAEAGAA